MIIRFRCSTESGVISLDCGDRGAAQYPDRRRAILLHEQPESAILGESETEPNSVGKSTLNDPGEAWLDGEDREGNEVERERLRP